MVLWHPIQNPIIDLSFKTESVLMSVDTKKDEYVLTRATVDNSCPYSKPADDNS